MKLISIAVACALFFAAVITELHLRLWPESRLALLALTTVSLFVTAFIGARFGGAFTAGSGAPASSSSAPATAGAPAAAPAATGGNDRPSAGRGPRSREDGGNRGRNGSRDDSRSGQRNDTAGAGRNRNRGTQASQVPADAQREEGEVKWFNRTKGFGFIIRGNGEEIFVHQRAIRNADTQRRPVLRDGQRVSFVVVSRERGLQAEDVIEIEETA